LFSRETTPTLEAFRSRREVNAMFQELTDELLDLTASVQGYRRAYLAEYRIILCCTCTVRFA
jgi:hypothetical protein